MIAGRETSFESMFPHRVCINLDRRPDRWAACARQFDLHGISVSRIAARDGLGLDLPAHWRFGPGAYGCALSHLEAVCQARDRGYESLLIFEDDAMLHDDFRAVFRCFSRELPERWDAILFGAIHREDPHPVSAHVGRIASSNSTFAYALRRSIFDAWIAANRTFTAPIDEVHKRLQREFAFYCSFPPLAWVEQGYSDILGADVNHWWVRDGLAVDGALSRQTIARTAVMVLPPAGGPSPPEQVSAFVLDRLRRIFPHVVCSPRASGDPWHPPCSLERFESGYDYWIVTDSDLYVPTWELKASLLKCREYDMVAPLHAPLSLTPADSRRAMNGDLGPVDTTPYPRTPCPPSFPGLAIVKTTKLRSVRDSAALQLFQSPSRIWRLCL